MRQKWFSSEPLGKKKKSGFAYLRSNQIIHNSDWNLLYPSILQENSSLLAKRRRNRFIIPLQYYDQEQEKEFIPHSVEIPINGILRRNSILAYFDDPQYRRSSSGIIKYGIIETDSVFKKEDLIEYRGTKEFNSKYQMKVDLFFSFPKKCIFYPDPR